MAGAQSVSAGFNSAGMAVQSIFGAKASGIMAQGYRDSAGSYGEAADIARKNAKIVEQSTELKTLQTDRQIYKVIGGQQSDVAGAGFAASGSALDLLADSQAQGELTRSLVELQGEIDQNAYLQQATAYEAQANLALAQADAADKTAQGSQIAGYIHAATSVFNFGMV